MKNLKRGARIAYFQHADGKHGGSDYPAAARSSCTATTQPSASSSRSTASGPALTFRLRFLRAHLSNNMAAGISFDLWG